MNEREEAANRADKEVFLTFHGPHCVHTKYMALWLLHGVLWQCHMH